jgi:hypothetical protein
MKNKPIIKFVGGSNYIIGVPARDLTLEEFEALPLEQQKQCIATGLYSKPGTEAQKNG